MISVAKILNSPSPVPSLLRGLVRPGKPRMPTMSPLPMCLWISHASRDLECWICAVTWTFAPYCINNHKQCMGATSP
jgi:hypothetical protein